MQKVLKVVIGIVLLTIVGALTFFAYMGGFKKVEVVRTTFEERQIIYSTHLGPYKNLSQSWEKFYEQFSVAGLESCDGLAIYLDKPDVDPAKLRTIIACQIDHLPESLKLNLVQKFSTHTLPGMQVLQATFPFKNQASYFMGPMIVYPKMLEQLKDGEEPKVAIELYGEYEKSDSITYIFPLMAPVGSLQPLFDAF